MFLQLFVGGLIITATIVVQVVMLALLAKFAYRLKDLIQSGNRLLNNTILLVVSVLWQVLGITINTWIWAFALFSLDEFKSLESAVYYAITSFTTLGYGDIILTDSWRILGSLSAVNGLIVFGLNTAFLVELMLSIWGRSHNRSH